MYGRQHSRLKVIELKQKYTQQIHTIWRTRESKRENEEADDIHMYKYVTIIIVKKKLYFLYNTRGSRCQ